MNHYCLCCKHCPDKWEYCPDVMNYCYVGKCKESLHDVYVDNIVIEPVTGCHYTPRPEPQFSQCVAVLKMLGVEVEQ